MYAMASYNGLYVLLQQCENDTLAKHTEKQSKESMAAFWHDSWQLKYTTNRDEKNDSVVKKDGYFPRGSELDYQHNVTPTPGDLMPSSGHRWHLHTWGIHSHRCTHIHINKVFKMCVVNITIITTSNKPTAPRIWPRLFQFPNSLVSRA